ncbi:MAG: contractile injection system protein, VgrG/Pvc8 family, partial [Gemmatimonadota bacterium]|nr:contractile injection system protein, VgrG/Pvc8 family [Gemmatimonadota bacterium]
MTSHIDLLTSDPNISAALHVRQARGTERLNQPFSVMLEIEYEDDAGLDAAWVKQLLTEPVGIRLHLADGPLEIHGQLRWLEMSGVTLGEKTTYGALLGPKVLSLEDTRRSRIFQDMDLPTLIRAVMSEAVLPGGGSLQEDVHYSLAGVTGTYPEVGDQIVQYEESDWAFLNRWLEHWGVHYHFRYEAVPGEAIMMFGDTNRAFPSYQIDPQGTPSDPKFDPSAGSINREGIWELRQRLQPQPASVVLRDYNWRKPEVGLQSQVPADVETGGGFRYFYGEHFKDPEEGQRIATLRAERLICERESVVGRASLPRLAPGASFVLRDHPLPDFTDLELRAVACVWTTALRTQSHPNYPLTQVHNRIELVRASLPWRPAHDQTPRPRV